MKQDRLHALADGIFAIVMTLLVLDLKIPELAAHTNHDLYQALREQGPVFLSYFISFALLFVYWRAHNFVISWIAKNLDIQLLNINAVFLFLVGFVPFSTHLLGLYHETQVAIIIYALNIIAIGATLIAMRLYVEHAPGIETISTSGEQLTNALVRTATPMGFAAAAIIVGFFSPTLALIILFLAVAYNFHPNAAQLTRRVIKWL